MKQYKRLSMVQSPDINWDVSITIDKTKLKKNEYAIVTITSNMPFTTQFKHSDNLKVDKLSNTKYKVTLVNDVNDKEPLNVIVTNILYFLHKEKLFTIQVEKASKLVVPNNVFVSSFVFNSDGGESGLG